LKQDLHLQIEFMDLLFFFPTQNIFIIITILFPNRA